MDFTLQHLEDESALRVSFDLMGVLRPHLRDPGAYSAQLLRQMAQGYRLLAAWQADQPPRLLFPNAQFITGRRQWQRACNPHARDKASYIPELLDLLKNSGRLHLIGETEQCELLGPDWRLHWSDGHTPGQLLPEVAMPGGPVVFPGDLIPGAPWVHLPITMGYDRFPEGLIEEKEALLADLYPRGGRLVFTHDPAIAIGQVNRDDKGRYSLLHSAEAACALAR